jgi:hypothetical protein
MMASVSRTTRLTRGHRALARRIDGLDTLTSVNEAGVNDPPQLSRAITVRALRTAGDVARPGLLHHGAVMPLFLRRPASLAQQAGSCFGRWLQHALLAVALLANLLLKAPSRTASR